VVKVFEPFDRSVLLLMKLIDRPPPQQLQSPHHTQRPSQSSSTHFDDAYYNTLTAEVLEIKAQQVSILESQTSLLNNQGMILNQLMNINIRMDTMKATQQEILQLLKHQFPQPRPSGSDV